VSTPRVKQRSFSDWVKKSHHLPYLKENPLLSVNLQQIGRLDVQLLDEWEIIRKDLQDFNNIIRFNEHTFMSALWVMAGYEFVRILKRLDKRPETKHTYELFRRVRIPLVKFESPKSNGKLDYREDFGIAQGAIGLETYEYGWAVAPNFFISRNELADSLYLLYQ
jgi:hypothetical protein